MIETDWKHRDFVSPPGAIPGCDFAGVVTLLGEGVTNVKVGDRVAGFVHGGVLPDRGSFSEYVKTLGTLVWKIPTKLAFDEAAALGGIGPRELPSPPNLQVFRKFLTIFIFL